MTRFNLLLSVLRPLLTVLSLSIALFRLSLLSRYTLSIMSYLNFSLRVNWVYEELIYAQSPPTVPSFASFSAPDFSHVPLPRDDPAIRNRLSETMADRSRLKKAGPASILMMSQWLSLSVSCHSYLTLMNSKLSVLHLCFMSGRFPS